MDAATALRRWGLTGTVRPADDGLINRTWLVDGPDGAPAAVLQWVNPIFPVQAALDIQEVGRWLRAQGLTSPALLPTADGDLWVVDDELEPGRPGPGHWRLLEYVPGRTLHRLDAPAQARAAGALVGRFHRAMASWPGSFAKPPRRIHETPQRMAELERAVAGCAGHPLAAQVREVGGAILDAWGRWQGSLDLPERPCHGDLKISNLRFAADRDEGVCLIDLDTLGPQRLADELGDAWRSWCNPAGEDEPARVRFDLDLFRASAEGWLAEAPPLRPDERDSLVPGIERICLELAARFCADAVAEPTYFREDRARFPQQGTHDLHRARVQLALADQARHARAACQAVVEAAAATRSG